MSLPEFLWNGKRIILCLRLKLRNNDCMEAMVTICGLGKDNKIGKYPYCVEMYCLLNTLVSRVVCAKFYEYVFDDIDYIFSRM